VTEVRPGGGTCLLVIDLQVGVVDGAFDVSAVLARTATLIDRARAEGVPVVFVQHQAEDLVPGTPGWRFADGIRPVPGEPVVAKRYRDAFAATDLEAVLAGLGVSRLVLAGAATDYCVRTTMQRAAADGYDVTLVRDCHTTHDSAFEDVRIGAEQIIAHTNRYLAGLTYPGRRLGIARHDDPHLFEEPAAPR
jgi:nicotinamidase-related amidase